MSGQLSSGSGAGFILLILALIVWSIAWKGMALWKAAQNKDKGWFIAILILNTLGLLEIIYIYAVAKKPPVTPKASPVQQ